MVMYLSCDCFWCVHGGRLRALLGYMYSLVMNWPCFARSDLIPPSSWRTASSPNLQLVHKELFLHHPLSLSDGNALELPLSDPAHFHPDTPPLSAARVLVDQVESNDQDEDCSALAGKCGSVLVHAHVWVCMYMHMFDYACA